MGLNKGRKAVTKLISTAASDQLATVAVRSAVDAATLAGNPRATLEAVSWDCRQGRLSARHKRTDIFDPGSLKAHGYGHNGKAWRMSLPKGDSQRENQSEPKLSQRPGPDTATHE